jgi:hypothetical protein
MRRLADEGIIEASLLDRDRPQQNDDRLVRLVAGIKAGAPDRTLQQRTLQQIAPQLEAMRERTPRSAVAPLIGQTPAGQGTASRPGWNHLGECRGSGTRVIAADIRPVFYRDERRIKSKPTSSSRSWRVACTRYGAVCMPRRPPSS